MAGAALRVGSFHLAFFGVPIPWLHESDAVGISVF